MSLVLVKASSQYLQTNAEPKTGTPFSMGICFNTTNLTDNMVLMSLARGATHVDIYNLLCGGNILGDPVRAQSRGALGSQFANTTTGFASGVWYHGLATFAAGGNARKAYINGGSKGSNAVFVAALAATRFAIGRVCDASPGGYYDGMLAEGAFWDDELSDDEAAQVGGGACPLLVRSEDLLCYWPLASTRVDVIRGLPGEMTAFGGASFGDGAPSVVHPLSGQIQTAPAWAKPMVYEALQVASKLGFTALTIGQLSFEDLVVLSNLTMNNIERKTKNRFAKIERNTKIKFDGIEFAGQGAA